MEQHLRASSPLCGAILFQAGSMSRRRNGRYLEFASAGLGQVGLQLDTRRLRVCRQLGQRNNPVPSQQCRQFGPGTVP